MSIEEKLENLENLLEQYERVSGLPALQLRNETEAQRLLTLSSGELKGMTAADCGEAAYVLEQFSLHIQRLMNREQERLHWAEDLIRYLIGPELRSITAYSWEERKLLAIRQNDAAVKAEVLRVNAQARIDRLSFVGSKIERTANTFLALQATRRAQRRD